MPNKIVSIAKNTSYFTLALIIQKVISFSYFTILARNLLPGDLGKYYFAISSVMIFSVILDMGLANVLTREVSKNQAEASRIFGSILLIKIPLTLITFVAILFYVSIADIDIVTKLLVSLASISMILDSYTNTFFAVIRGHHNLKYESFSAIFFQVILFSLGLFAITNNLDLQYLMYALISAGIFSFTYSSLLVKFKFKIKFFAKADYTKAKELFKIALPFGSFVILQRLYMYLDTVLLAFLAGEYFVGLYQIPFKIIFAMQFLPMAFVASLYPAFASYWKNNREQIPVTFSRAINYLLILSLPISFGVISLADKIIMLFKPEYISAVPSLQIIMASLVFIFLNFPIGSLLNACDLQKRNMLNMAITLMASVSLNFILIPNFQIIGASITVYLTNLLMFFLGISQISKIMKYNYRNNLFLFLKVIFASSLMAIFCLITKNSINTFIVILSAALIYFIALYFLKGFSREDIKSIKTSFLKT